MRIGSKLAAVMLAGSAAALMQGAWGQEFPSKVIRVVVPNPIGSTADVVARLIVPEMSKVLGQPMVIEPKPGGDQRIGAEYVAKQVPADGHTIAVIAIANLASIPALVKNPGFDPLRDLTPVTTLVAGRIYLGSPLQSPWKNFGEMVAYAKANPGKLNYGSTAVSTRLRIEAILQDRELNVVYIPYPTTGAEEQGLYQGHIQLMITSDRMVSQRDRVLALAVSGRERSPRFPDVPTYLELGLPPVPGAEYSLNVPAGTPKAAFDKLYAAVSRALQQPELRAQMTKLAFEVVNDTPEAAARNLAEQAKLVADVVQRLGLRPQ